MGAARGMAAGAVVVLLLTGCGGSDDEGGAGSSSGDRPRVVAGFYPLEYLAERIGGDTIELVTLTSPGVDPHDLELSPRDVGTVGSADLVLYASGMQAAVDAAVEQQNPDHVVDAAVAAGLVTLVDHHDDDQDHDDQHDGTESVDDGHDHGEVDPHFWLDPNRYADVAQAVSDELSAVDPANAASYQANVEELIDQLTDLDEGYRTGLESCEYTEVITTHAAFGYLTDRYGLVQIPMTGISPESEPSPGRMAQITRQVDELGVPTIYSEIIAGTQIADTIANETGVNVVQLDPIEGLSDASPGEDYLEIMEANLEALRTGQVCS